MMMNKDPSDIVSCILAQIWCNIINGSYFSCWYFFLFFLFWYTYFVLFVFCLFNFYFVLIFYIYSIYIFRIFGLSTCLVLFLSAAKDGWSVYLLKIIWLFLCLADSLAVCYCYFIRFVLLFHLFVWDFWGLFLGFPV